MERKKTMKLEDAVIKPVSNLIERFNLFIKNIEKREKILEVDGFISDLLNELKDAEKGILGFFEEILFMYHLSERMVSIENEISLVEILGERTKEFLKPDFIKIYLMTIDNKISSAYSYPVDFNDGFLTKIVEEGFEKGESFLYERKINGKFYSILLIPLRTTKEKYGLFLIGKERKKAFSPEEIALMIAGSAVISFSISNIKLMQKMIVNERLVMIGQLISGLSHDLRNILTKFENGIYFIETGLEEKDIEDIKIGKEILKKNYIKLKEFVLSMVDYSRDKEVFFEDVNLHSLIDEVISYFESYLKEKNIKIVKELDKNLNIVKVDRHRMERMFSNLIQNSIDAVKENEGIIEIKTKLLDTSFQIIVEDNGCGIPEKNLDKIFDIFFTTKGSRGTGFGLAIVEKVVKEHKGKIDVISKVGEGTTFTITLPKL
ncbi:MAG: ATP-binding protein [Candidatus Omnitrophica bacterium]|nr:ATP-binding protein [Candidatus Omnitrophota bacterium]MCM8803073.1 ATP-binding protein [Candidatus Omnitrophota bacterium]